MILRFKISGMAVTDTNTASKISGYVYSIIEVGALLMSSSSAPRAAFLNGRIWL